MPSLKDRMAAFQAASSPDAFEKQKKAESPARPVATKNKFVGQKSFTPTKTAPTTPSTSATSTPTKLTPGKLSPGRATFTPTVSTPPKPIKKGKVVENKPTPNKDLPKDWDYLFDLSVTFDNYKAAQAQQKKTAAAAPAPAPAPPPGTPKKDIKSALEGVFGGQYTAKADWLNNEWISSHLAEDKQFKTLTFRLGDPKLFGRFDKTDEKNRDAIIDKFIDTLFGHPKAKDITALDLSNCLLPDEFLMAMSTKVLASPTKGLPKLHVLNLETNLIQGPGLEAMAKVIRDDNAWRYLQVLMLENQKKPITSEAEEALADAIVFSQSLAVVSLRVRGDLQRQQINNTVAANIDNLRQARRERAAKEGTLKARKRNEMEQYWDNIAANSSAITKVELVGDAKFLALKSDEKIKAGSTFANNTHVTTVQLVKLQLDDKFAVELGKALKQNTTITKLVLDSNSFTGTGIKAVLEGMASHPAITELQIRHQSKTMSSADEELLPPILESNNVIIKLGVDARNQLVRTKLDKKTNANREYQRKMRAQAKKAGN